MGQALICPACGATVPRPLASRPSHPSQPGAARGVLIDLPVPKRAAGAGTPLSSPGLALASAAEPGRRLRGSVPPPAAARPRRLHSTQRRRLGTLRADELADLPQLTGTPRSMPLLLLDALSAPPGFGSSPLIEVLPALPELPVTPQPRRGREISRPGLALEAQLPTLPLSPVLSPAPAPAPTPSPTLRREISRPGALLDTQPPLRRDISRPGVLDPGVIAPPALRSREISRPGAPPEAAPAATTLRVREISRPGAVTDPGPGLGPGPGRPRETSRIAAPGSELPPERTTSGSMPFLPLLPQPGELPRGAEPQSPPHVSPRPLPAVSGFELEPAALPAPPQVTPQPRATSQPPARAISQPPARVISQPPVPVPAPAGASPQPAPSPLSPAGPVSPVLRPTHEPDWYLGRGQSLPVAKERPVDYLPDAAETAAGREGLPGARRDGLTPVPPAAETARSEGSGPAGYSTRSGDPSASIRSDGSETTGGRISQSATSAEPAPVHLGWVIAVLALVAVLLTLWIAQHATPRPSAPVPFPSQRLEPVR